MNSEQAAVSDSTPFTLPPLPYAMEALAPVISERTVWIHYTKHHRAYLEKLNALVEGTPLADLPLEQVVRESARKPELGQIFNNAAQAWNHSFYWRSLAPNGGPPPAAMRARLHESFGNGDAFERQLVSAGTRHFGSGWVWLAADGSDLIIVATANADNPLKLGLTPLLGIDLWEHAYYLDYQNRREQHLQELIANRINWEFALDNLEAA